MSEHTYFHDLFLIYFNDSLKVVHFSLSVLRILIFSKHLEYAFSPSFLLAPLQVGEELCPQFAIVNFKHSV